jgi:ABC-type multidrug transport system permease subunit
MKITLTALVISFAAMKNFEMVFRSGVSSYGFLGSLSKDILNIVIIALVVLILIIALVNGMINYVEHKIFEEE